MRPYGGFGAVDERPACLFEERDEDFLETDLDEPEEPDEAAEPDDADAEDVLCAWE